MKTIEEVASKISSPDGLNKTYRKARKNRSWVLELLDQAYIANGKAVKLFTKNDEYLSCRKSAEINAQLAFTISAIYEQYIANLKREYEKYDEKRTRPA